MSRLAYTVLTTAPDLTEQPLVGLHGQGGRVDTEIGQGDLFAAWRGSTQLALRFSYRLSTPAVNVQLRNFMNQFRGRGAAFLLPSWHRDFRLAAAATAGDTALTIVEGGLSDLADDRPDTEGRVIFTLLPDGTLQILGVTSAADGAGSTEVLQLDTPLASDLDIDRAMVGFVYLVRLADDEIEYRYNVPGQGAAALRFVTVLATTQAAQNYDATSSAVGALKAFPTLETTDEDPVLQSFQTPTTIGPDGYGSPQGSNYSVTWQAHFSDTGEVSFDRTTVTLGPLISTLYNSGFNAEHLSLGFDSAAKEALAWSLGDGTFRLAWFESGVETRLDIAGISPVFYNTFEIDSTTAGAAGDAELACFYLKPGFSTIFCRLFRDSFATEYRLAESQSAPIYLHRVVKVGNRIEIQGMDSQHRRARWISETYVPPIPDQYSFATLQVLAGSYDLIIAIEDVGDEGLGASIELPAGEYISRIITHEAPQEPGAAASLALAAGRYQSEIIAGPAAEPGSAAALDLAAGSYNLIARQGSAGDGAAASLQLESGTYEIP